MRSYDVEIKVSASDIYIILIVWILRQRIAVVVLESDLCESDVQVISTLPRIGDRQDAPPFLIAPDLTRPR